MTIYSRVDFDEDVRLFATETRKKTRKPVQKIGWKLHLITKDGSFCCPCLVVSVLDHEGIVHYQNVAI
jgi:hypothetical protein